MRKTQHSKNKRVYLFVLFAFLIYALFMGVTDVFAWTLPGSDSFAYDVYDIFVNKLLKGAPGAVAAVAPMAGGIVSAVRSNFLGAGICSISSLLLYKAPDLIQKLGFTI